MNPPPSNHPTNQPVPDPAMLTIVPTGRAARPVGVLWIVMRHSQQGRFLVTSLGLSVAGIAHWQDVAFHGQVKLSLMPLGS